MKKKITIGITGGIGSGKSTVARLLAEKGYPVISADEIAKEITEPGSEALDKIASKIGRDAISPDGTLNRSWLRKEISHNPKVREMLDSITHPIIQKRSRELRDQAFSAGSDLVFYEAPLLFEAKSNTGLDGVICVHAEDPIRIQRVRERDQRSLEEIEKLLKSQMPQAEKMKLSNYWIENNGDKKSLLAATNKVMEEIKKKFSLP